MNIFGHLVIAGTVRKAVGQRTGIRLSLSGFLYGNILPDLSARYGSVPHFYRDSFAYVIERAQRFRDTCRPVDKALSFSRSLEAGVITHYLSDYFCYAHSERCTFNIYRHHLYEMTMLAAARKGRFFYERQRARPQLEFDNLKTFIAQAVNAHEGRRPREVLDIYCALEMCDAVVCCLTKDALPPIVTPTLPNIPSAAALSDSAGAFSPVFAGCSQQSINLADKTPGFVRKEELNHENCLLLRHLCAPNQRRGHHPVTAAQIREGA